MKSKEEKDQLKENNDALKMENEELKKKIAKMGSCSSCR
jgi:regulator of replication initiation timing